MNTTTTTSASLMVLVLLGLLTHTTLTYSLTCVDSDKIVCGRCKILDVRNDTRTTTAYWTGENTSYSCIDCGEHRVENYQSAGIDSLMLNRLRVDPYCSKPIKASEVLEIILIIVLILCVAPMIPIAIVIVACCLCGAGVVGCWKMKNIRESKKEQVTIAEPQAQPQVQPENVETQPDEL